MTPPVVEVRGAVKEYRRFRRPTLTALNQLDLTVEAGGVHGFLGPNGSGKTTTIRALLGLIRLDDGTMRLFGDEVPHALPHHIGAVGALVESPLFFNGFTGRRNLQVLARAARVDDRRVDECLELVGLGDRGADRFKGYSLGMRHRLGVAAALLKQPKLLILDEPTNGLDPAGIVELRDTLRALGSDGRTTVFFSSHQLSEVQHICDSVSILVRGRLITEGTVADVVRSSTVPEHIVGVDDLTRAQTILRDHGLDVAVTGERLTVRGADRPAAITERLASHGLYVSELYPVAADLESVFLELTREPEQTSTAPAQQQEAGA
jgi:ABC-2 type transport system ATP-binding protein